jgi:hypothetical protein
MYVVEHAVYSGSSRIQNRRLFEIIAAPAS